MTGRDHGRCYRVKLPSDAEARRIRGIECPGYVASERPGPAAILCGAFGPPCFHCGGVSEALCDFPLREVNRTCDRALCLECAPEVGAARNYCHEHDEHGRRMLLFPQPKRIFAAPGPAPRKRAKTLPRKPPESHRWRVREASDAASHGAVLSGWATEIAARQFAKVVGGRVETWDEFATLWRQLYPLANKHGGKL